MWLVVRGLSRLPWRMPTGIIVSFSELTVFTLRVCISICKCLFACRILSTGGEKWLAQVPEIWEDNAVFFQVFICWPGPTGLYWRAAAGRSQRNSAHRVLRETDQWQCFGFRVTRLHRAMAVLTLRTAPASYGGITRWCTGPHHHPLGGGPEQLCEVSGRSQEISLWAATTWAEAEGESLHEPRMNSLETVPETQK